MKYYIIAGEASGDLHGSNLIKALMALDSNARIRCWGGDKMAGTGAELVEHYKNTAFMGFIEVLFNLRKILRFISDCKADITSFKPDVLVLIDYPGFNIRIAEWAKKKGMKVVYYITPQVWAWHKSRVHTLGKYTDRLLVILPFEPAFFDQYHYHATYVGHPLLDAINQFQPSETLQKTSKPLLALLPGSRKQEIRYILPVMLEACRSIEADVALAGAPSISDDIYQSMIEEAGLMGKVTLFRNQTYDILAKSDYAWVGSGTATLETALFGVPQIVCYKGHPVSYAIAKRIVKIPYISLVNLIAGKEIVKELIQENLTVSHIIQEMENLQKNKNDIKEKYKILRDQLGHEGASARTAEEIIHLLNK